MLGKRTGNDQNKLNQPQPGSNEVIMTRPDQLMTAQSGSVSAEEGQSTIKVLGGSSTQVQRVD